MKTTLRQLDRGVGAIAEGHDAVADYYWGDWVDSFEGRVQKYPASIANVSPSVSFGKVTRLTLNIIIVDQVASDQSNLKDVESDTLQTLHDFYRVFKHSPNWKEFCVVESANVPIKFKDSTPDEVAGWQGSFTIKLIESEGLCDLPLSEYDFTKKIKC
jgi:hypothetical protein